MNGMVGISNKPGGYTKEDIEFLEPFTVTCSNLLQAYWQIERTKERRYSTTFERMRLGRKKDNVLVSDDITSRRDTGRSLFDSLHGPHFDDVAGSIL